MANTIYKQKKVEGQITDQGWRAAIVERLQKDFHHVRWQKARNRAGYSTKFLEVGFHTRDMIVVSVERREHFNQRDIETFRDSCLVLFYRKRDISKYI